MPSTQGDRVKRDSERAAEEKHVIDLVDDPAFLRDPFSTYARWRESGPVHRARTPDGGLTWLVTRHQDVRAALTDPRLAVSKSHANAGEYQGLPLPPALSKNLLGLDPPDHTRLRRLVSKAFTPRRIEAFRPLIQQRVDSLLDAASTTPDQPVDLVEQYAAPLSVGLIAEMLGVPAERVAEFRALTARLLTPDPARPAPARAADATSALTGMVGLIQALVAAGRADPGPDLLGAMVDARDEQDRLTEDELTSLAFIIVLAGYENSVYLVANSVLALLSEAGAGDGGSAGGRPGAPVSAASRVDIAAAVADDLPEPALDELIRFADPNQFGVRRFATVDLMIGEVAIRAGQSVLLGLASARRDPRQFTDPDTLDLARSPNPHLSFGAGMHYCLGAPLARLQVSAAVATVLRRFPRLALAVPADELCWRPTFRSRGLQTLPVRLGDPAG
jgi:cytochrome P450